MSSITRCDENCLRDEVVRAISFYGLGKYSTCLLQEIFNVALQGTLKEDAQERKQYSDKVKELINNMQPLPEDKLPIQQFVNSISVATLNCCTGGVVNTLIEL